MNPLEVVLASNSKFVQNRKMRNHAVEIFLEVKNWRLGLVEFEDCSNDGTCYIEVHVKDEIVKIRLSNHMYNPRRQQERNIYFFNRIDFESDADCLTAAKEKVEEILSRVSFSLLVP